MEEEKTMVEKEIILANEEQLKALEDKLLRVVKALIAHTEREKTDSLIKLRTDLYATGVMPDLFPP
jgi:hypothetical protein